MAEYTEIERKFLVIDTQVVDGHAGSSIAQGYLHSDENASARVRLTDSPAAYLAFKGPRVGAARLELEDEISLGLGERLLWLCEPAIVTKIRYPLIHENHIWQVDVFQDANAGLIVAEIELSRPDEPFSLPRWCGREVTDDPRYYNEYLAVHPFCTW